MIIEWYLINYKKLYKAAKGSSNDLYGFTNSNNVPICADPPTPKSEHPRQKKKQNKKMHTSVLKIYYAGPSERL